MTDDRGNRGVVDAPGRAAGALPAGDNRTLHRSIGLLALRRGYVDADGLAEGMMRRHYGLVEKPVCVRSCRIRT